MRHIDGIREMANLKKGDRKVEDAIPPKARWFDNKYLDTWWDDMKESRHNAD